MCGVVRRDQLLLIHAIHDRQQLVVLMSSFVPADAELDSLMRLAPAPVETPGAAILRPHAALRNESTQSAFS